MESPENNMFFGDFCLVQLFIKLIDLYDPLGHHSTGDCIVYSNPWFTYVAFEIGAALAGILSRVQSERHRRLVL